LVAGAFFPHQSWVAPSAYFLGMTAIIFSGISLKKTRLFAGDTAPFIMELPAYHFPQWSAVLRQTYDRSKSFVKKAGTIIFVSSIVIWFSS
ncbi:ferrous iron transport protein B, partial [Staphylococcus aureus]|nr:ferrous iron transport protein B [Staphylococcus aureus]